jgi:hypothetical protein
LKWYDGGGENGITSKRILEVEVFFSSQNIEFSFYLKTFGAFFLLFFFFLCSVNCGLQGFDDI